MHTAAFQTPYYPASFRSAYHKLMLRNAPYSNQNMFYYLISVENHAKFKLLWAVLLPVPMSASHTTVEKLHLQYYTNFITSRLSSASLSFLSMSPCDSGLSCGGEPAIFGGGAASLLAGFKITSKAIPPAFSVVSSILTEETRQHRVIIIYYAAATRAAIQYENCMNVQLKCMVDEEEQDYLTRLWGHLPWPSS